MPNNNAVNNILYGVTDGSNAAAGSVGQIISSIIPQASAVSLPSAISNITSLLIPAGDWLTYGNIEIIFSAGGSVAIIWINAISAALPADSVYSGTTYTSPTLTANSGLLVPMRNISLSTPTTFYLSADVAFSTGTCLAHGYFYARRMR